MTSRSARRREPSPEAMTGARALVEGTALSLPAIVRESGIGLRVLRRLMAAGGWRRPPEAPRSRRDGRERLARLRDMVEGTRLTQAAIARELAFHPNRVSVLVRQHGWVRSPPEQASAVVAPRWPKRPGRPFRADVVPLVRELYTRTTLSLKAISARTGVSFAYVSKLGRRHGWTRPDGAPLCNRHLDPSRAGSSRRLAEGRRRVRTLAERWAESWAACPAESWPSEPDAAAALGQVRALAARTSSGTPA